MKEQQYKQVSEFFSSTKTRSNTIKVLHDILPGVMMVFYPLQLILLLIREGQKQHVIQKEQREAKL